MDVTEYPLTGVSFFWRHHRAAPMNSQAMNRQLRLGPQSSYPGARYSRVAMDAQTHNFSLLIPVKNGRIVLSQDAAVVRASPKMAPFFPGIDRIVLSKFVHR